MFLSRRHPAVPILFTFKMWLLRVGDS